MNQETITTFLQNEKSRILLERENKNRLCEAVDTVFTRTQDRIEAFLKEVCISLESMGYPNWYSRFGLDEEDRTIVWLTNHPAIRQIHKMLCLGYLIRDYNTGMVYFKCGGLCSDDKQPVHPDAHEYLSLSVENHILASLRRELAEIFV